MSGRRGRLTVMSEHLDVQFGEILVTVGTTIR
jgi:hypothetical protein